MADTASSHPGTATGAPKYYVGGDRLGALYAGDQRIWPAVKPAPNDFSIFDAPSEVIQSDTEYRTGLFNPSMTAAFLPGTKDLRISWTEAPGAVLGSFNSFLIGARLEGGSDEVLFPTVSPADGVDIQPRFEIPFDVDPNRFVGWKVAPFSVEWEAGTLAANKELEVTVMYAHFPHLPIGWAWRNGGAFGEFGDDFGMGAFPLDMQRQASIPYFSRWYTDTFGAELVPGSIPFPEGSGEMPGYGGPWPGGWCSVSVAFQGRAADWSPGSFIIRDIRLSYATEEEVAAFEAAYPSG